MGVTHLWKLLAAAGRNIDMQSLSGKRVAVDISIWMIRILHGMSKSGVNFKNVHLIAILKRLIYLLQLGIQPIFVFDGPAPQLKRDTLNARAQQRQQSSLNLQKIAERYVVKLLERGVNVTSVEDIEDIYDEVVVDEESDGLAPEEQDILDQQQHEILNLQYQATSKQIDGFEQLDIATKQELLMELLPSNTQVDQSQHLQRFVENAIRKERIREIQREAQRQLEQLRIEKYLDKNDDQESRLIKEYLQNNEDLVIKLGSLGIDNIYMYLQDDDKRKQLVKLLYGQKKHKQKKLKDYQLENEQMRKIRETMKNRYQNRDQDVEPDEVVNVQQEECNNLAEMYDLNDIDQIALRIEESMDKIQQVQEYKQDYQIKEQELQLQSESEQELQSESESDQQFVEQQQVPKQLYIKPISPTHTSLVNNNNIINIQQHKSQQQQESTKTTSGQMQSQLIKPEYTQIQSPTPPIVDKQHTTQSQQIPSTVTRTTPMKEGTQAELDQFLTQIDQNDEDISTSEMLQHLQQAQNISELDFTTLQSKFEEVRYLLQLFGIPWVMATGEAEAQCAYLQIHNLVDCVITDDSDVFLFGATRVIKGLFEKQSQLQYYDMQYISEDLGLNRNKLILMALFLGSDYTYGIKGVGIVNAMEIVEVFDSIEALKRFADWASKADILLPDLETHYENVPEKERHYKELHKNYKKYWELPYDFPSLEVIDGYMNPRVDESLEKFSWGKPAIDKIEEFCTNVLEFSKDRITEQVSIPLRNILHNDQRKITDYFRVVGKIATINSRRINNVVQSLNQPNQSRNNIQPKQRRNVIKQIYQRQHQCDDEEVDVDLDQFKFTKQQKK